MFPELSIWLKLILAFAVSLVISYFMTPPVKGFAEHVGAIDVPKDDRRVHDHPIPRMGGLAIFLGFVLSLLIFGADSFLIPAMMGIGVLLCLYKESDA